MPEIPPKPSGNPFLAKKKLVLDFGKSPGVGVVAIPQTGERALADIKPATGAITLSTSGHVGSVLHKNTPSLLPLVGADSDKAYDELKKRLGVFITPNRLREALRYCREQIAINNLDTLSLDARTAFLSTLDESIRRQIDHYAGMIHTGDSNTDQFFYLREKIPTQLQKTLILRAVLRSSIGEEVTCSAFLVLVEGVYLRLSSAGYVVGLLGNMYQSSETRIKRLEKTDSHSVEYDVVMGEFLDDLQQAMNEYGYAGIIVAEEIFESIYDFNYKKSRDTPFPLSNFMGAIKIICSYLLRTTWVNVMNPLLRNDFCKLIIGKWSEGREKYRKYFPEIEQIEPTAEINALENINTLGQTSHHTIPREIARKMLEMCSPVKGADAGETSHALDYLLPEYAVISQWRNEGNENYFSVTLRSTDATTPLNIVFYRGNIWVIEGEEYAIPKAAINTLDGRGWIDAKTLPLAQFIIGYCYIDRKSRDITITGGGTDREDTHKKPQDSSKKLLQLLSRLKIDDVRIALSLLMSKTGPIQVKVGNRVAELTGSAHKSVFSKRPPAIFYCLRHGIPSKDTLSLAKRMGQTLTAYVGKVDKSTLDDHGDAADVRDKEGFLSPDKLGELSLESRLDVLSETADEGVANKPLTEYLSSPARSGYIALVEEKTTISPEDAENVVTVEYFFRAIPRITAEIRSDMNRNKPAEIDSVCQDTEQLISECLSRFEQRATSAHTHDEKKSVVYDFRRALCSTESVISREILFAMTGFAYLMDCVGIRQYNQGEVAE